MSTNRLDLLTPKSPPNTAPTSQAVTMPKCESLWHIKEMLFLKHVGVAFGERFHARYSPSPFREFRTKFSTTSKHKNSYFHKKTENAHKTDKTLSDISAVVS